MNYLRGVQLPQAKLSDDDVRAIRSAAIERERLRNEARQLSNNNLAERFGVHPRTIEKVLGYHTWIHILEPLP